MEKLIFRGRTFTPKEIKLIKGMIKRGWLKGRTEIARKICKELNWRQENGRLKEIACLEALRKMEKRGLISLPLPKSPGGYKPLRQIDPKEVSFKEPKDQIAGSLKDFGWVHLRLVEKKDYLLFRYLIGRYHYLGFKRTVGRHLRYLVYLENILVGCLGYGDAILHHHLRDEWIGWSKKERKERLHLIVNNVRFLILPWVRIKNLASKILAVANKVMPKDWEERYGYRPVLLETFIDVSRFQGTCYKAANWKSLGYTQGKGRRGDHFYWHGERKELYVYPLSKDALSVLHYGNR